MTSTANTAGKVSPKNQWSEEDELSDDDSGLELRQILRILIEQRKLIILASLLGLALGLTSAYLTKPRYRASALLEYNPFVNDQLESSRRPEIGRMGIPSNEVVGTQIGLLKSEALARRVAEDLNLAALPAYGGTAGSREQKLKLATAMLVGGTAVEPVKGSMLIRVTHSSGDPAMAARISNALADGFIASSLERRFDSSSYARKFLGDQITRTKVALEDSERALNSHAINSNVFRTPGQTVDGKTTEGQSLAAADLVSMNEALNQARVKRIGTEEAFRNGTRNGNNGDNSVVKELIQRREMLRADYADKTSLFKPDYPVMRDLSAQIARLDVAIQTYERSERNQNRQGLQSDYQAALQTESRLARRVSAMKREVQGERSRSIEYNILQREVDTNRALYDALLQRFKEVGVAGGVGQSNIALVDAAKPPSGPYKPNMLINALLGLVAGLGLGVGAGFVAHLLFDNIVNPDDVRRKLGLRVLGVIPKLGDNSPIIDALADPKSDTSEAYYSALTAIKFARDGGLPHSIFVTSTKPGEGKSTSAYAIACSMARLGNRVLLIDADLRRPTFEGTRTNGNGLATLLSSEAPLESCIEPTKIDKLTLLPAGKSAGSVAEMLSSTRLAALIAEAKAKFQFVVIDGPPVLGLTDAPLLGTAAEATVIVIESGESRTGNVNEMIGRLTSSGSQIIGTILTKISRSGAGTGYGYSGYSYNYSSDRDLREREGSRIHVGA